MPDPKQVQQEARELRESAKQNEAEAKAKLQQGADEMNREAEEKS